MGIWRIVKPAAEKALPVYIVDEPACMPADQVVTAATAPPVEPSDLEMLLRCLLPTAQVPTPPPQPILSGVPAPTPTPLPNTGITGMETLLQRLLPGTPVATGSR